MKIKIILDGVFGLPSTSNKARQVFYGVMLAGVLFVPMLFLVYQHFIALHVKINLKEFFIIFSAIYLLFFIFCMTRASNISASLRKQFGSELPRDVTLVGPAIANSKAKETILMGQKYWFWQLVGSYFTGITFAWFVYLFVLFVVQG